MKHVGTEIIKILTLARVCVWPERAVKQCASDEISPAAFYPTYPMFKCNIYASALGHNISNIQTFSGVLLI